MIRWNLFMRKLIKNVLNIFTSRLHGKIPELEIPYHFLYWRAYLILNRMKIILRILCLFLLGTFTVNAQYNLSDTLRPDPDVRIGTLSNGMKYYIARNTKPEKRAELRLAVDAGSTSENDDQQGLAHLTEHMAFNGTKNFKKNELVDYLESVGTKFGPHLNAYTSFDETVYMLQIPTDTPAIVEKGLQILEDWAHNLSFDSIEVEKERGVVVEEWRLGQGADERMRRQYWPVLFKDSRYAVRLPIGKKEIIEGAGQGTLRSFYQKWYRPDLMAVIAVGDFDPAVMEKTIIDKFSKIPAAKNNLKPESYPVPDNKEVLVSTSTDKEAVFSLVQMIYKLPVPSQATVSDYRRGLAEQLFGSMLNARTAELQHQADPPFMFSFSGYQELVRTKYAYISAAVCKETGIERALQNLVNENERVRRYGFTESELSRAKAEMMSAMDKLYKERDKTESRNFAQEYVSNFLTGEPMPGISAEYKLYKEYLDGIKLSEVNAFASKWITDGADCVVVITAPDKASTKMPTDERIREIVTGMQKLDLKPYEDKVVNKGLVEGELKGSRIIQTIKMPEFGITQVDLGNGIHVMMKPTEFKNDEILFTAYSWGGWSLYPEKDYMSAANCDQIIDESGIGEFDAVALEKALSGKIAGCSPYVGELSEGVNGSCSPKDVETMFQLIYNYFTSPRKDSTAFLSFMDTQKGLIQNKSADPNSVFRDTISYVMSGYNFRYRPTTLQTLSEINLERAFEIYKERFSDASGFRFYFVGNFKTEELVPLIKKYLGSLPSLNKKEMWKDIGVQSPKGTFNRIVKKGIEPKAAVVLKFEMPFVYNRNNRNEVNALNKLLNIRLREVLREEKSGVYGVGCRYSPQHYPKEKLEMTISFGCAPDNVDMLVQSAMNVLNEVKSAGCDDKNLLKIKETSLRERETLMRENQFWLNTISSNDENGEDLNDLNKYNDWVNSLKKEDFLKFSGKYLQLENMAKFILLPEK